MGDVHDQDPRPEPRHRGDATHVRRGEPPIPPSPWNGLGDYSVTRFRALLTFRAWRWWMLLAMVLGAGVVAVWDGDAPGMVLAFRSVFVTAVWFYVPFVLDGVLRPLRQWWRTRKQA
ncbi:MAG: hypothetical protein ACJ72E_00920 [Marmoricola sp.]